MLLYQKDKSKQRPHLGARQNSGGVSFSMGDVFSKRSSTISSEGAGTTSPIAALQKASSLQDRAQTMSRSASTSTSLDDGRAGDILAAERRAAAASSSRNEDDEGSEPWSEQSTML